MNFAGIRMQLRFESETRCGYLGGRGNGARHVDLARQWWSGTFYGGTRDQRLHRARQFPLCEPTEPPGRAFQRRRVVCSMSHGSLTRVELFLPTTCRLC